MLAASSATREGSTYQLHLEDDTGKKILFELSSDQALRLADALDNLLADEEDELHPRPPAPEPGAGEGLGAVKWYNATKGFGFVTPDSGGEELFLHRTVVEQAGVATLPEGTRVRFQTIQGQKGLQVSAIALA